MTVHIIGAGVAGLAAAVRLVGRRQKVVVWEAGTCAGGRARSFPCPVLDRTIDNGTHIVFRANKAVGAYLKATGGAKAMTSPGETVFPFVDVKEDLRWVVRPGWGRVPLWLLWPGRRVPGTRLKDYASLWRLSKAGPADTVAGVVGTGPMMRRFWDPLTRAVMNAAPDEASAQSLWAVVRDTLMRGARACRPRFATQGLSAAFVDPALKRLKKAKAAVHFNSRLEGLVVLENRVHVLHFADQAVELGPDDAVILALPPSALAKVWPGASLPQETRCIVNAHFRVEHLPEGAPPLIGVVGGRAHWVAVRGDVVSVTVSAADDLAEQKAEDIAPLLWRDAAKALGVSPKKLPARYRVIKERRATFFQTPQAQALRPRTVTKLENAYLAGDWTATELPATLESAVTSGHKAADEILKS